jgi:hypothetical protein
MIVVETKGRLGNQMFQYAFGLAAARRLGTEFAMAADELRGFFLLDGRSRAGDGSSFPVVKIDNSDYDEPEEVLERLADDTVYSGYFQSERFFADAADEVRAAFRLRAEHEEAFRARYGDLLERPYVCCHVRRTDYLTFFGGIALPVSYYRDGLARLAPEPGTPIVFVGDDLDEVRAEFASLDGARFEQNEAAVDLQLLLNADALVVSNGTFAWWGAWLNARPGKRVLAPRHWIGFNHRTGWHNPTLTGAAARPVRRTWEYPRRVIPADWIQIPVRMPWRERLTPAASKASLALLANNARALLQKR